ncbi:MAG: hypothetical protein WCO89_03790 [Syntrophus sp. (in: bacteria)]
MHGNNSYQVHKVFNEIRHIGKSKHKDKEAARADGAQTWHAIGQTLGVYSYATLDKYRDVAKDCLAYAKKHFGIKDIEMLTAEAVQGFLEAKIDLDVKYATFQTYAAAVEKLGVALNKYSENHNRGREYDFSKAIAEVRKEAQTTLDRYQAPRAYDNPHALRENLSTQDHKLVAAIQHEGGTRVSEATYIKEKQLLGNNQYEIRGKGGKLYPVKLGPVTYSVLRHQLAIYKGTFEVNQDKYRDDLRQAAEATEQDYNGSHGLRWNYAQEKVNEVQEKGSSYNEALRQGSQSMGHERIDVTERYLTEKEKNHEIITAIGDG